jgi:hypothetical protein
MHPISIVVRVVEIKKNVLWAQTEGIRIHLPVNEFKFWFNKIWNQN